MLNFLRNCLLHMFKLDFSNETVLKEGQEPSLIILGFVKLLLSTVINQDWIRC